MTDINRRYRRRKPHSYCCTARSGLMKARYSTEAAALAKSATIKTMNGTDTTAYECEVVLGTWHLKRVRT